MKQTTLKTGPLPLGVAFFLASVIFTLDLYTPVGIAIGTLYVAPVALIAMWSPPSHSSLVIVAALFCSTLTITGLGYVSSEAVPWVTLSNHALALGAIWATVVLSLLRKRKEQKIRWIDLLPRL